MAVEAEYPSNIFLLLNTNSNSINVGNGGDERGGESKLILLDHHNIIHHQPPNTVLSRKRPIEHNNNNNNNNIINHDHQFLFSCLNTSSSSSSSSSQYHQSQSHIQNQQQQQQNIYSQYKNDTNEINNLIQWQEEQLRLALANTNYTAILAKAQDTAERLVREKDHQLHKATRRNANLQARAAHIAQQSHLWEAKARAHEATAASLKAQLHNTIAAAHPHDRHSAYVDPDRVEVVAATAPLPSCRGCRTRAASAVVLPCRHFCICNECDALLRACPVCLTVKNSTVEVFLS